MGLMLYPTASRYFDVWWWDDIFAVCIALPSRENIEGKQAKPKEALVTVYNIGEYGKKEQKD
jgi:hypothetical protein